MGINTAALNGEDTLRIGLVHPLVKLDPTRALYFADQLVGNQVFQSPFAEPDSSGKPTSPLVLAASLRDDSGGEGLRFSAPVRDDILFSDGTQLTPQHVLDSLKRSAPLTLRADVGLDGDRITFNLKRPNARFDLVLAQAYLGIVLPKGDGFLGTGPYMLDPTSSVEEQLLVRNPNSRTQAKTGQLLFKCYPPDADGKPTALLEALEKGEVDFTNILHQEDVRDLVPVHKFIERANSMAILFINNERPHFKDVRVRRAIGMAIDRLAATELSYATPMAYTARNLLPLSMSMWRDGLNYDLEKAKQLLQEVGEAKPSRLVLRVIFGARPYLPKPMQTAGYIAKQLGELGIEVEIVQTRDGADWVHQAQKGDYDFMLGGWVAESGDPAEFFEALVTERTIPTPEVEFSNHCNMGRWHHRGVEDALLKLRTEPTEENQRAVLRIVADEVPMIPLMTGAIVFVHSYRVSGFAPTPWGIPDFSQLELRR